jgi:hypothetical protein
LINLFVKGADTAKVSLTTKWSQLRDNFYPY